MSHVCCIIGCLNYDKYIDFYVIIPNEDDEEAVLIAMHEHHGNKWTLISKQLPGRSDNDVKVYIMELLCSFVQRL